MPRISEETQALIERAEPDGTFTPEGDFVLEQPPAETPKRGKKRRGRPPKARKPSEPRAPRPAIATAPVEEGPPITLIRGTRWMLRNVVVMMETAYGWDKPEDYDDWLTEASQLGANVIQKHFPDWMQQWGDEILLLAILLVWVTPNASKKLGERKESHQRNARPQGERKDDPTMSLAQSA